MYWKLALKLSLIPGLLILSSCGGGGGSNSVTDGAQKSGSTVYFSADNSVNGVELWKTDGTSANTQLVKDINLKGHSNAKNFTQVGNVVYFSADDGVHGNELWKHDSNGVSLVKDLHPDTVPAEKDNFSGNPYRFTAFNGQLIFAANNGIETGVWVSDGTESGTVQIASTYMYHPVVYKNELYFSGNSGIWKTDGTVGGTSIIIPGVEANTRLTATDSLLYFAHSDANGRELWSSDGTVPGTQIVLDINSDGDGLVSKSHLMHTVGDTIYFTAQDANGLELWKSDGTAVNTVIVKDINPGTAGSFTSSYSPVFAYANNLLFFFANDGSNGNELWVTDGTDAGTRIVVDLNNSAENSFQPYGTNLVSFNNSVLFVADLTDYSVSPAVGFGREIYITDGTAQATGILKDIYVGVASGVNSISDVTVNNELYFTANTQESGRELWKTNGTESGTVQVKDINPGVNTSGIGYFSATDSALYFSANDGVNGAEVWTSNGDAASTNLLADINNTSSGSSNPSRTVSVAGYELFVASTSKYESYLYRTDGTESGTESILKMVGGNYGYGMPTFLKLNEKAYFIHSTESTGVDLWKTDGTVLGTEIVKDIVPDSGSQRITYMTVLEGNIYFVISEVNATAYTTSLWKSDGTDNGTVLVKTFNQYAQISYLSLVNGKLVFPISSIAYGIELWVSNGTPAGTVLLKDINTSANQSATGTKTGISENCVRSGGSCSMSVLNNELYFIASDNTVSRQLWKTDGTTAGTVFVKEIDPTGAYSSYFDSEVYTINGKLVLRGFDSTSGSELWVSDGSAEGTQVLKDIGPGNDSIYARIIEFGDKLMFFARTEYGNQNCSTPEACQYSEDIWITDGTEAGTRGVKAGPEGFSSLQGYLIKGGRIYFSYSTNDFGTELWVSDATSSGTYMIKDINPGRGDGSNLYD